ncbi:hypothetical protein ACIP4S_33595 [Streptomyces chartreusis]|uniref:hypothetical protein n=1 Tax=Streptomyces chartreusis TaxID=1969 RepID=UPI0038247F0D
MSLGYSGLDLGRAARRTQSVCQTLDDPIDGFVLACPVSHSSTCLKWCLSASAEILTRTCRAEMIIALRSRNVVWNRPRLMRLEGEADQRHEQP